MIEEIKDNACGSACSHKADFYLEEMQLGYEEVFVNKKLSRKVVELKHHVVPYDKGFESNTCNLIDIVDINTEGSSFLFKESLIKHMLEMLCLLIKLIMHDNKSSHTTFDPTVKKVVLTVIINITYHGRRYSVFRLCYKSALHATDPKYFSLRLSNMHIYKIDINNKS